MKAAYIEQPGPPEAIHYGDLPKPEPTHSGLLVRVAAVAVNPIDTYIRSGAIKLNLPYPFIVGCDLAGTVESVGSGVSRFRVGDRVWGSNQGLLGRQGTFSEYVVADEQWLYPIPAGVTERDAAAVALVGITAHLGCFREGRLAAGETIFVHGGTGGVGACVVQMAKAAGARVITTAGSEEKAEAARKLGADVVILYRTQDVSAALREAAPGGCDVWFETLREQNFEQILGHMKMRGRIVVMAGREARPVLPIGPFYTRDLSIRGFAMFNAPADEQRAAAEAINGWMSGGKLRAKIDRVLPLDRKSVV